MKTTLLWPSAALLAAILLSACSEDSRSDSPAPHNAPLAYRYQSWSNDQLEFKRAEDLRYVNRGYTSYGPPDALYQRNYQNDTHRKDLQVEIDRMTTELMRRDSSGKLVKASDHFVIYNAGQP